MSKDWITELPNQKLFLALFAIALAYAGIRPSFSQTGAQEIKLEHAIGGKAVQLTLKLFLPKSPGPHSVAVVLNSSSGKNDHFFQAIPNAFVPQGIAVVLVDSFTPRGVLDAPTNLWKVSTSETGGDALAVLKYLRGDSRFKPNKIALTGHSRGGLLSYFIASSSWYFIARLPEVPTFDAMVALSPSCTFQFAGFMEAIPNLQFLAIMGEKDDWAPAKPCVEAFQRAKTLGKNVDAVVIANASHSFGTSGATYNQYVETGNGCLDDPIVYSGPGKKFVSLSGAKEYSSWTGALGACRRYGATVGGERDKVPEVMSVALTWLRARGW